MIALALTIVGLVALLAWLFVDSEKQITAAERSCESWRAEALASTARANAAERRLEAARDTMLSIAEGLSQASQSTRTAARTRITTDAPACPVCHVWEVRNTITAASRVPVLGVSAQDGWRAPFTVRWGDA